MGDVEGYNLAIGRYSGEGCDPALEVEMPLCRAILRVLQWVAPAGRLSSDGGTGGDDNRDPVLPAIIEPTASTPATTPAGTYIVPALITDAGGDQAGWRYGCSSRPHSSWSSISRPRRSWV